MTTESDDRGVVLITGASTGIGRACALRLDGLGFRVFAGVRRTEDGEGLQQDASDRLTPVRIDVTEQRSIDEAAEQIAASGHALTGLVNNAGVGTGGPYEFIPIDTLRMQFEVNYFGHVAVTQAFIPALRQTQGRIVNMGSIAGRMAPPFVGSYAASKFAMEAFTDSLRVELSPWKIAVSIIEPGVIATPIWEKATATISELRTEMPEEAFALYGDVIDAVERWVDESNETAIEADKVAKAVEHALTAKRPKARYLVGGDAKQQAIVAKWIPTRLRDWLVKRDLGIG
jgi:NAD(P)-dependent dehydrogenase (short-subunit alcohol dehydrogenase family)